MEEFFPIILDSQLFSGINEENLKEVLRCVGARQAAFARGQDIFRPGEHTQNIGLVLTGHIHILREDFWGNRNILTTVMPGEVFGEVYACLPEAAIRVGATAEEPTKVLFLDAGRVLSACPSACAFHGRLIRNLLGVLAVRNLTMNEKLIHLTQRSIRGKLLSYLSAESLRQGGEAFDIPYNRQQLADYLSVDRSALSAELGRLREEGVLEFNRNHFRLRACPET